MANQLTTFKILAIARTEGPSRRVGKQFGVSHKTVNWIRAKHPRYAAILESA